MKSHERWIEIRFITLCNNLYMRFSDYMLVTAYIEFLADLAKMDKSKALRLLQKIFNQINIRPSKPEFITVARQNNITIDCLLKTMRMSKTKYIALSHTLDFDLEYKPHCAPSDIEGMEQLLKAQDIIKELTL